MSLFQFAAAMGGFAEFNGAEVSDLTLDEEQAMAAFLEKPPAWMLH